MKHGHVKKGVKLASCQITFKFHFKTGITIFLS